MPESPQDEYTVDSYWLPDGDEYKIRLDVHDTQYTLSWQSILSVDEFVTEAFSIEGLRGETARGEFTINGVTEHLEMGEFVDLPSFDGVASRDCTYCKVRDERDGHPIEIDWVWDEENAHIELTTSGHSPREFEDFIIESADEAVIDQDLLDTVLDEAEKLIQSRHRLER